MNKGYIKFIVMMVVIGICCMNAVLISYDNTSVAIILSLGILLFGMLTVFQQHLMDLMMMCLPIMFYGGIGFTLHLSLADMIFPLIVIGLIYEREKMNTFINHRTIQFSISYSILLLFMMSNSMIGILFAQDYEMISGFVNILKILINIGYMMMFLIFFLKYEVKFMKRFIEIWNYTAIGFSCLCIGGVALFYKGIETKLSLGFRAVGTVNDPNLAASYLLMSLGIALAYNQFNHKKIFRYNVFMILLALALTASKGGMISLIIGLLITIGVNFYHSQAKQLFKLSLISGIGLVGVLMILNAMGSPILENAFERVAAVGPNDGGTQGRLILWKTAFDMGLNHPILGVGMGQFLINALEALRAIPSNIPIIPTIPHNTYFSFFAETGGLGLLSFLWLPFVLLYKLYQKIKRNDPIAIYVFLGLVSVLISGVSINIENFRILWIFFGFALYLVGKSEKDDGQEYYRLERKGGKNGIYETN